MQSLPDNNESSAMPSTLIPPPRGYWLRFAGSAIVATIFVLGAVTFGVGYYEPNLVDPVTATMQAVTLVDAQDPELKKLLQESGIDLPIRQNLPPPKPAIPQREISGFVQIAYTVNPDGTTGNIRVLGAVPKGYYEEQAIAEITRRMHSPDYENGVAVSREMETVVEFTLPADSRRKVEEQE